MAPFESLYGRKCKSPLYWDKIGEKLITGPDLVERTLEKIKIIRERLKVAQDRNKSWADSKRWPLELQPGKKMYIGKYPTPRK